MYNSFKETSIGQVPEHWEVVRLGDVFEPVNIKIRDFKASRNEIPVLSMTRSQGLILQSEKFDKRVASRDIDSYKVVKQGQLVYGFPIDEGVIAILHRYPIGAVSPAYHVWQPVREIDPIFTDYFLKTPPLINLYMMFSSNVVERRRNLSARDFMKIEVPLPPLPEQRAITHVLSTVRQSIEATEHVIAAARELKRSLMKYLFTYGPVIPINQADQVVLQETEIGDVNAAWKVGRLGEVITSGPQNGLYKPQSNYGEGIPIVRINDFDNEGSIVTRAENRVNLSPEDVNKYRLHKDDLLVNRVNSLTHIGKTALVGETEEPIIFESNMIRFSIDTAVVIPKFIFRFLTSQTTRDQMRGMAKRAVAQSSINQGDLASLVFPVLPLEQQVMISDYLDKIDAKLRTENTRKDSLEILFSSLLHHLITGGVRV